MKLFLVLLLVTAGVAIADWQYYEEIDPITDEATRLIYTQATSDEFSYSNQPILLVRITGDIATGFFTELWVDWPVSIGEGNLPICVTRIDSEDSVEFEVSPSASTPNNCTFFLYSNYLFVKLLRGNQFVVRFTPSGSNTMTVIFSLDGMTAAARNAGMPVDLLVSKVDTVTYTYGIRFTKYGEIIRDNLTNLEWRVGPDSDTSFEGASRWIWDLGDGWRIPYMDQLIGLYNAGIECEDWGLFQNSGFFVWSIPSEDDLCPQPFNFVNGSAAYDYNRYRENARAFAVRSR